MKRLFYLLLITCFQATAQTDTIKVYFDIGLHEATESELQKLDIDKTDWQKVDLISYTDYLGTTVLNEKLSLNRSREIRSRLVQRGLNTESLGIVEGKGVLGVVLDHLDGIQENRRTDIIIWKSTNDIKIVDIEKIVEEITPPAEPKVEFKDELATAQVGDHLVLRDITFIPGQHFISEESTLTYLDLLDIMKENPKLKIQIEGHICCKIDNKDGLDLATNQYNLSEARAKYIYDILIDDGIDAERLSYKGFARENPLYPLEETEEEKQLNRRVEILILEK